MLAWQKAHSNLQVRWIKPENLHITVVPPWYVAEDGLYEVIKVFEQTLKDFKTFPVLFEKILFGPPGQPPRLIWTEGETPEEFKSLKSLIEDALMADPKTGFWKKEKRPGKLHLTIARFRPGSIKIKPLNETINWRFETNRIDIMASELKRTGAEYTTLQIFNFQ